MNNISVTPKGGTIASLTNGSEVTLATPSLVKLNLNQSDIKSYTRNGNNLIVTTKSGEHLVIHNFYGPNGENDLVLQDDKGALLAGIGAVFAGSTGSGGSEGGSNNAGGGGDTTAPGTASSVEVLRLQRDKSDLELKMTDMRSQYYVLAREDLAKATAEADSLLQTVRGREDTVSRLTIRAPMRGVVKDIKVTTVGGVIPPNGELMNIVPMDDHLLIEARLSPRDIAFIHPDQKALVKISAYDYSIYGGLDGVVESISPDTIQDEVKPEIYYYRVYIRTDHDFVQNKAGKRFSISPGMVATVDIKTGEKTVMDYLIKPFNRAKEALRER